MRRLSSLQLIESAIDQSGDWKDSSLELEERGADPESAAAVIEAYEEGRCPPWLAACLLGSIAHPNGYATALAILRAGPGMSAESYAGPALAKMLGDSALPDLEQVLADDEMPSWVHRGAAHGLGLITDPRGLDVLLAAVDHQRIEIATAGFIAHERRTPADTLLAWLESNDVLRRNLAAWTIFHWSSSMMMDGPIPLELSTTLLNELDRGGLSFDAEQEQVLRIRLR
jgi:hypothetical protein